MEIQLPLGFGLRDEANFGNYITTGNETAVAALRGDQDRLIYLWGGPSVGKTHLLHAWSKSKADDGLGVAFIPLAQYEELSPNMCDGLEFLDIVCIDDIQTIVGKPDWEEALFHLFNRIRDAGKVLLIAGTNAPSGLGLALADLESRLNGCLVLHINALDDQAKIDALRLRASLRGFELTNEVGQFLLRRVPRDMSALFSLLDKLDHASLMEQRRLTIPFVKQVMEQ